MQQDKDIKNTLKEFKEKIKETNDYEKLFLEFAEVFMREFGLEYNSKVYNFVDVEFYFFDNEKHPDPYVHKNKEQQKENEFYFHGSGIDFTFGDENSYGGILIRGLKEGNKYYNGSLKLIENLKIKDINELKVVRLHEENTSCVFSSTRVGLQVHPLDYELYTEKKIFKPYIFRQYRFIIEHEKVENKCKDKTKINFYNSLKNIKVFDRPKYKQDSKVKI